MVANFLAMKWPENQQISKFNTLADTMSGAITSQFVISLRQPLCEVEPITLINSSRHLNEKFQISNTEIEKFHGN